MTETAWQLELRIKELEAANARLSEALLFYADGKHYSGGDYRDGYKFGPEGEGYFEELELLDDGEVAREALRQASCQHRYLILKGDIRPGPAGLVCRDCGAESKDWKAEIQVVEP